MMDKLIPYSIVAIVCLVTSASAQSKIVTDTTVAINIVTQWETMSVIHERNDSTCSHEWVDGPEYYLQSRGCLVLHGPEGCSYDWPRMKRICALCGRLEVQAHVRKAVREITITPRDATDFEYQNEKWGY